MTIMADDRQRLLEHYGTVRAELLAAIAGLSDAALSDPSLDGWSVKDHLAHLAAWDEIRASEVSRISAGHESAWRTQGEQEATYNRLAHELRRGLSAAQVKWEIEASHQRVLDAIAAASARGLDGALYGEAGLVSFHEAQHTGWIRRWRAENGV